MHTEKIRVYVLAKMLNMESKDLLDMCQELGFDVKNQLSSLDPEQREAIEARVKQGGGGVAVAAPPKPVTPPVVQPTKVRVLDARPRMPAQKPLHPAQPAQAAPPPPAPPAAAPVQPSPIAPPTPAAEVGKPAVPVLPKPPEQAPPAAPPAPPAPVVEAPSAAKPPTPPPPVAPPAAAQAKPETPPPPPKAPETPQAPAAGPAAPPEVPPPRLPEIAGAKPPTIPTTGKPRDLTSPRPEGGPPKRRERIITKVVHRAVPPTPLKAAKPPEEKKQPPAQQVQKPVGHIPKELLQGTKGPVNVHELQKKLQTLPPIGQVVEFAEEEEERGDKKKPGAVAGRDKRHAERAKRQLERKGREQEKLTAKSLLTDEEERHRRGGAKPKRMLRKQAGTLPPKSDKIVLQAPITVRALSEALGVRSAELIFKLRDQGAGLATINSTLETDVAQMIALDYGRELEIKKPLDAEEQLLAAFKQPDRPEDLVPRAPVVTIMGHVDHGKTSLLDRIRKSNVVATEAGGITQVIRAWRVEHNGRPLTFLDTPGHEAFTKMRARGANVTDIAVIVVAADDGVMPQTEEAISHARAAGVSLVVAINKVDLPNANVNRTRQQLYGLNVLPDNMGGDVPFVETSAATGKGIDDLLETLSVVAELKELKANPNRPAEGTCLEAKLDEQEGVQATLLVQNGTLRKGDVVLCGASSGRVRAMYDDQGRPIQEAGPSVPVRVTGLDEVPNADDRFQVVPDLAAAREIAQKRREKLHDGTVARRAPLSLDALAETKVAELKVILKADFRGSIEAIRKELEKLHHEEVCVRVLHAGIGSITESDVQLALTSPQDTLILGFNVVPDNKARALAEERGIPIREYNVIYELTEDVRAALEGKLKPREEIIHLGRAVVRETFKISRVGTIAGCYVTQGVIERSAKVRVIREGVVVYPPPNRTVGLESLKRFKEDVREVREGFECGLKVAGYDDVKVGDVIEAYRVEQVQRTLEK